ncbi:MAG: radical SAM family heme chaperone HemW [Bacteroidales bacterium]|nr:radical SAM family heme chaperone HemW [Bacteroidales bacterium]
MIYVHIPFCRSFCTYCDFYSEVAAKCRGAENERKQEELFGQYADALVAEVKARGQEITDDANTLYIGGGTPSVLPLYVFERLLEALRECGHGGPYDEFTVEVNPEDIVDKGEDYVRGLLDLGVNRISMGVQSFDDGILKFMNRRHSAAVAREAYAILENAGVRNISVDLIFGLPQLSDNQWKDTLKDVLEISPSGRRPQHISAYQLSVEPGSMLARLVEKGRFEEASDELCERQYSMLCEALVRAGYHHYEISNFAQPGYEAVHNSAYWKHIPYVGFGPGAHSFSDMSRCQCNTLVKRPLRQWNRPDLQAYIVDPLSVQESEILNDEQLILEKIMLALRTSEGINAAFLEEYCDPQALARAIEGGSLVRLAGGRIRIPESRFFVSDSIIADIV